MKTIIIGVGGPTNSGKTTLAKHLFKLINDLNKNLAIMIHQDDFALPELELPFNEELKVRDWDNPIGTIDYKRLNNILNFIKKNGKLPKFYSSHDHLNQQPEIQLNKDLEEYLKNLLKKSILNSKIEKIIFVDGFLLYYNEEIKNQMNIKLFLQCSKSILKFRRENRGGYATAENTIWQDPPEYFDFVVWPGYVKAHEKVFENGNVETGNPIKISKDINNIKGDGMPIHDLIVIQVDKISINDLVKKSIEEISKRLESF